VRVFVQNCAPLEDAIEVHAFAPPLEALACVRPMAFLSGVRCLYRYHLKFCPNAKSSDTHMPNALALTMNPATTH
jgi:hypothetical protein